MVCAGDSLTGWNNIGQAHEWPYPTYPQYLEEMCDRLKLSIANGGIAGEISRNGIAHVNDYPDQFPGARYFVIGYGTNDLGIWPDLERTSRLHDEHFGDALHPNGAGATIIAQEVFGLLRALVPLTSIGGRR